MVHPTFIFLDQISRYFKCQFFQNMPSTATSEYTKVSFNIFVKFTQKYPTTASYNFNFYNFVKKWNFWNSISAFFFFNFHGGLFMGILPQKKSGYMEWYLFFFADIWTFFFLFKSRPIIVKKKSRYHKKSPDITPNFELPGHILA